MDPQAAISLIASFVQTIYNKVQQAKANKEKCDRLLSKITRINESVQALVKLSPEEIKHFTQALSNVLAIIRAALDLVIKLSDPKYFILKVITSDTDSEALNNMHKQLDEALPSLQFGVAAQDFVNQKQDRLDDDKKHQLIVGQQNIIIDMNEEVLLKLQEIQWQQRRDQENKEDEEAERQELFKNQKEIKRICEEELIKLQAIKSDQRDKHEILLKQLESIKEMINTPVQQKHKELPRDKDIAFSNLLFDKKLGEEKNGAIQIWKGRWLEQTVVIKLCTEKLNTAKQKSFIREINVLSKLKSGPNVVTFHGACIEPGRACSVFEYDGFKTLSTFSDEMTEFRTPLNNNNNNNSVNQNVGVFSYREQLKIARDIAAGIYFIHDQNLIHRHLTTSTIFMDKRNHPKIGGFELVKIENLDTANKLDHSFEWLSQEMLDNEVVTNKTDIFSFGGILWELFTGNKPPVFQYVKNDNNNRRIKLPEIPNTIPTDIQALIKQCWAENPHDRPDASTLISTINRLKKEIAPEQYYLEGQENERFKRYESALKCYKRAEKRGFYKASTNIATFFYNGVTTAPNPEIAFDKALSSAKQGHDRAMKLVIKAFETGEGVEKNIKEAAVWCDTLLILLRKSLPGKLGQAKENIEKDITTYERKYAALIHPLQLLQRETILPSPNRQRK